MRKAFVEETTELFENYEEVVLLLGDIGVFGFKDVIAKHPYRAINLGILEQSMLGVAAGMASKGMIPIVHTIAPFLIERALEQIKVDFGYQSLPGNLVSVGASFDYAAMGCTHHCPADVNLMCNIPGAHIFIPGHQNEFRYSFKRNWRNGDLNYYRLSEKENSECFEMDLGDFLKVEDGENAALIVVGPLLDQVRTAIEGLGVKLFYTNSISATSRFTSDIPNGKLIIVEPYYSGALYQQIHQGFEESQLQVLQIGVPKTFVRNYGTHDDLIRSLSLDSESLRLKIKGFIES